MEYMNPMSFAELSSTHISEPYVIWRDVRTRNRFEEENGGLGCNAELRCYKGGGIGLICHRSLTDFYFYGSSKMLVHEKENHFIDHKKTIKKGYLC